MSAKQHSVQDSSNVKAGQPKLKKKPPAVVARDRARRKEYLKRMKVPRQLRAENLALFYKLQELQTAREILVLGTYICCSSVIQTARITDGSQSTDPCGQTVREIRLLGTYICCFSVIPAARYRDGSQSTGPCGQTAREIRLLGTYIFCLSVIQSWNH